MNDIGFDLRQNASGLGRVHPEPYRCVGHERSANNHAYGAIIAPVPPISMLAKFFAHIFGPQHLAADQRRFQEMRAKQGRRSDLKRKRLEAAPPLRARIRKSRARPKPSAPTSLPTVENSALAAIANSGAA